MIEHTVIDLGFDIIGDLHDHKIINLCTHDVLKTAEKNSGFIAGGFATAYVTDYLTVLKNAQHPTVEKYRLLSYYTRSTGNICSFQDRMKAGPGKNKLVNVFKEFVISDIDVWFESREGEIEFRSSVKNGEQFHITVNGKRFKSGTLFGEYTPMTYGIQYMSFDERGQSPNMIQIISRMIGGVSEITSSFDIYNAACAIKGTKLYIPVGFERLLKQGFLHLYQESKNDPFVTLCRLKKWRNKQHFKKGYTPSTRKTIARLVDTVVRQNETTGISDYQGNKQTTNNLLNHLFAGALHVLSSDMLLKLSMYFRGFRNKHKESRDDYDRFFNELLERAASKREIERKRSKELEIDILPLVDG